MRHVQFPLRKKDEEFELPLATIIGYVSPSIGPLVHRPVSRNQRVKINEHQ